MRKYLAISVIFFLCFFNSFGKEEMNPQSLFSKANVLYSEKNYKEAILTYEKILADGNTAAEVYFNLGNSYFKENDLSTAILNYERARTINPGDEDVIFNLRMAYNSTVDKIEPVPILFYQRWWQSLIHIFSPGTWSIIAISLIWITLFAGIVYLFAATANGKRNAFLCTLTLLFISMAIFYLSYSSHRAIYGKNEAIILASTSYIRSSPDVKSTKLFMLHEGTKVIIIDDQKDWKQIKIANGNVGWIEKDAIEKI